MFETSSKLFVLKYFETTAGIPPMIMQGCFERITKKLRFVISLEGCPRRQSLRQGEPTKLRWVPSTSPSGFPLTREAGGLHTGEGSGSLYV